MLLITSEEVQRRVQIDGPQSEMSALAAWLKYYLDEDMAGQDDEGDFSRVQAAVHDLLQMLKGHMG